MAEWKRPSPETAPTASKATGLYMIGTLSKHQAEQQGYADALMLDWRGRVAETTGANIFFVMDGELHTPDPDCFLDGITRRSVMSLARRQQIKVVERPIEFSEVARATEVFLAGTAAEVTPVREIAGHRYTPARDHRDAAAGLRRAGAAVAGGGGEGGGGVGWPAPVPRHHRFHDSAGNDVGDAHDRARDDQGIRMAQRAHGTQVTPNPLKRGRLFMGYDIQSCWAGECHTDSAGW